MTLGKRIQYYRKRKQLTQEELAEKLMVSRQAISRWESDNNEPDVKTLLILANIFEITVDELVRENEVNIDNQNIIENGSEDIIIHQQEEILRTHRKNHRLLVIVTSIVLILLMVFVICPLLTSLGNITYETSSLPEVEKVNNMTYQISKSQVIRGLNINVGITSYQQQKIRFEGFLSLIGTRYEESDKRMIIHYDNNTTETLEIFENISSDSSDPQFMFNKEIAARDIKSITFIIGEQTINVTDIAFPIEEYLYGLKINPQFSNQDNKSFFIDLCYINSEDGIGYLGDDIQFETCMHIYQETSAMEEFEIIDQLRQDQKVEVYKNNQLIHTEKVTSKTITELIHVEETYDINAEYKIIYSFKNQVNFWFFLFDYK